MADEISIVVRAEDSFSGVLGNFGNIMTGVKSIIDLAGQAFGFFKNQAMEGLEAIASYERLTATLTTLSAIELQRVDNSLSMADALELSGEKAQELLDWMQELAIKSPFTLEGVANAFRLAEAYGFTSSEAQRLTQAMIDFAAGSGASEHVMSQIALALGQIQAKGKLAGQEVLQLVNAGLPVTQILADAFGVTTAEIEKMRADGLIPAHEAIEAITSYLETNFAGAAERQANTWAGLKGTFEDIKQMGLREYFGGLFDVLQPLAIQLSEFLQTEGLQQLREAGNNLGEMASSLIEFGRNLQGMSLSDMTTMLDTWVAGIDWELLSQKLAEGIDSIDWSAVGDVIGTRFARIFENLGSFIGEVDWSALGDSIFNGLVDMFEGIIDKGADGLIQGLANAFGDPDVATFQAGVKIGAEKLGDILLDVLFPYKLIWEFSARLREIIQEAVGHLGDQVLDTKAFGFGDWWEGIITGFTSSMPNGWMKTLMTASIQDMIDWVKELLGIASPSTVFAGIGTSIVDGLKLGIMNAWDGLVTLVKNLIGMLLEPFAPVLGMLGIDMSGLAGASSGTTGGVSKGGGTTATGGRVTNNYYFYGPTYLSGVGPEGSYDCTPSPIISATNQTLSTSGLA